MTPAEIVAACRRRLAAEHAMQAAQQQAKEAMEDLRDVCGDCSVSHIRDQVLPWAEASCSVDDDAAFVSVAA